MNNISPLACVSKKAILGDNIEIGPFAFVDDDVEIGDGCKILPHATIFKYVKMGKNYVNRLLLTEKRPQSCINGFASILETSISIWMKPRLLKLRS